MATPEQTPQIEFKRVGQTALTTGRFKKPDGTECVMFIILRDDVLQVAVFISPEQADHLAEDLMRTAAEIRTGLVMPPASKIQMGD
jgi:hypothetical protein